ncbi:MAG: Pr6Pr family membrane protein, partial [Gaiellaceae bacterium]
IQSNILAVVALALAAVVRPHERSFAFEAFRGAVVLYMGITGVVFALLLSGLQEELQTATPWVDFVVHKLLPAVVVADWLLDPPRHRLSMRLGLAWLAFPLAYVIYTLIRGSFVDWYPYPFLDVSELGYGGVLARCAFLAAAMAAGAVVVVVLGNGLRALRRRPPPLATRSRLG